MPIGSKLRFLWEAAENFAAHPRLTAQALRQALRARRGFDGARSWPAAPAAGSKPAASNPFRDYLDSHRTGRGVWKWSHYADIYQRHFSGFVGRDVGVVEVGIQSGGSLEMWRECFGPKSRIYGVDLDEGCRKFDDEKAKVFIGDQGDRGFWSDFRKSVPSVDILIDDGCHETEAQIVTLEEMLPHLRPGGVYLCEDILDSHNAFTGYLFGLLDALNERRGGSEEGSPASGFQSWIGAVHFYPYVAVIEKTQSPVAGFPSPRRGTAWR